MNFLPRMAIDSKILKFFMAIALIANSISKAYANEFEEKLKDFFATEFSFLSQKDSLPFLQIGKDANIRLKKTFGGAQSRFVQSTGAFNEPYKIALKTETAEWLLVHQTSAATHFEKVISQKNRLLTKDFAEVWMTESLGGNAGLNSLAVNFLITEYGEIIYVGNFQNAPDYIRKSKLFTPSAPGLWTENTVIVNTVKNTWELLHRVPKLNASGHQHLFSALGEIIKESFTADADNCAKLALFSTL